MCADTDGEEVIFNVADNGGEASSMLNASAHLELFPHVRFGDAVSMVTQTVDRLLRPFTDDTYNLMVIDAQGAELKVLRGAVDYLDQVDGIFVEVSEIALYEGGATLEELDSYMRAAGFFPKWLDVNQFRYGDAFYLRETRRAKMPEVPGRNLALDRPTAVSSVWWGEPAALAARGNDGSRTGRFGFHTARERAPWWRVDLEQEHALREIRVHNRLDAGSGRARFLQIFASRDDRSWDLVHQQAGQRFGGADGHPLRIQTNGLNARYIKLALPGTQFLHLDEVEIY